MTLLLQWKNCILQVEAFINIIYHCTLWQDFEEQLDKKDRLIKKLQSQIKSLEKSERGLCFWTLHCDGVILTYSPLTAILWLFYSLQPSQPLPRRSPRITWVCWSVRERTRPGWFKTSSWVLVHFFHLATGLTIRPVDNIKCISNVQRSMHSTMKIRPKKGKNHKRT